MPTETYKSEEAYRKARAYTHIHNIPTHSKKVCIKGGKCHAVKHGKKKTANSSHKKTISKRSN